MGFLKNLFSKKPTVDLKLIWDDIKSTVRPLAQPCIRLVKTQVTTNSHIGGKPRVNPDQFEWPHINDKPMSFIAQLDLAELSTAQSIEWLPKEGTLLFFYEMEDMVWGFDPKDKGHWKILYTLNPSIEIDFPASLDSDFKLKRSFLSPTCVSVMPSFERDELSALNLSDEQLDAYIEYQDEIEENNELPKHQVSGYPSPVQGDGMELEAQLASNGLYCGDASGYDDPRRSELEKSVKDWRLLLQIDTDDDLDIMWGDCGMIYFWIKEDDARNKNFEDSWLVLQCC